MSATRRKRTTMPRSSSSMTARTTPRRCASAGEPATPLQIVDASRTAACPVRATQPSLSSSADIHPAVWTRTTCLKRPSSRTLSAPRREAGGRSRGLAEPASSEPSHAVVTTRRAASRSTGCSATGSRAEHVSTEDWELLRGLRRGPLRGVEDWHLWVKIVAMGREVAVLPEVGLHYRRRPGQMTAHVPWSLQEPTRARVLQDGLPIMVHHPVEVVARARAAAQSPARHAGADRASGCGRDSSLLGVARRG